MAAFEARDRYLAGFTFGPNGGLGAMEYGSQTVVPSGDGTAGGKTAPIVVRQSRNTTPDRLPPPDAAPSGMTPPRETFTPPSYTPPAKDPIPVVVTSTGPKSRPAQVVTTTSGSGAGLVTGGTRPVRPPITGGVINLTDPGEASPSSGVGVPTWVLWAGAGLAAWLLLKDDRSDS